MLKILLYKTLIMLVKVLAVFSLTVRQLDFENTNIDISNTIDLDQVLITCKLNDLVIIDVPVIKGRVIEYILHRPNGRTAKLNLTIPESVHYDNLRAKNNNIDFIDNNDVNITAKNNDNIDFIDNNDENITFYVNLRPAEPVVLNAERKYQVFNLENCNDSFKDIFAEKQRLMKGNEFMIGPLSGEDHGNWLLRCIYDDDGKTVAVDQVIVIEIVETVPVKQNNVLLRPGDTFMLQFAYPIEDLETCELITPTSAVDRAYDRNRGLSRKSCGYVIYNVTTEDSGIYEVLGVGRIVYIAKIWLVVW